MTDKGKNNQNDLFGTAKPPRKGAMYVRMSTDHQKYSIENQEAAMREYAARHDIDLIKTYTDGGRSGLSFGGRSGLQNLIADVQAETKEFESILVLDVTRWGRYQDVDESALCAAEQDTMSSMSGNSSKTMAVFKLI